ncbi:DUF2794 domain-containing protein [Sphingosinicella terrae]|jgi:hypothetical protein|uniref:DUF2794 domain-containing protein n=1 Tax=Sphingosinicella terrae TaxID=2172047 RepID=UPI000E0DE0A1|nr:DUF2794 domain-containing protein [Sphingosinicella terrae]
MGQVLPFPSGPGGQARQTGFTRTELNRIVDLYGRMVAAGLWKDYAIELRSEAASFWCFRRAAERPEYRIEKRPAARQGPWALIGEQGQILRRGHELGPVLAPIERRLMKVVAG